MLQSEPESLHLLCLLLGRLHSQAYAGGPRQVQALIFPGSSPTEKNAAFPCFCLAAKTTLSIVLTAYRSDFGLTQPSPSSAEKPFIQVSVPPTGL